MWREQAITVIAVHGWSLLLLAATVQSFAHMPLGLSDRNSCNTITAVRWPSLGNVFAS